MKKNNPSYSTVWLLFFILGGIFFQKNVNMSFAQNDIDSGERGLFVVINSNFRNFESLRETLPDYVNIQTYNVVSSPNDPVNLDIEKALDMTFHGTDVLGSAINELNNHKEKYPDFLLIKAYGGDGTDKSTKRDDIAKAIRVAADRGADVINISSGYIEGEDDKGIEDALVYARSRGSIVVAATGNEGKTNMMMSYPARSSNVIGVGEHDTEGHPTSYTSGVGDERLDFTARVPDYLVIDEIGGGGNSFAAPVVAADAYLLKRAGDPSKYDINGDGKLSQEEVIMGLNDEAGKKFKNISSITYDRAEILRQRYGFLKGGYQKSFADDPDMQMYGMYYYPEKEENYIEGYYLNSGRFNEFIDALDDIGFEEQEYCYKSHAFQLCGFESLALCESMMPQDVGGCGKIGDMVNTQDGLEGILAADIDGDGIPDGEADGNFWDDLLGSGDPSADSGDASDTGADGCAAGFAMENGICMPSSSGLHSPEGSNPMLEVLRRVMLWLLSVIGFVAIVAFVISGIQYLISAGDQNMIETAKRNMKWSIVGVVTALSGLIILQFIYIMMS